MRPLPRSRLPKKRLPKKLASSSSDRSRLGVETRFRQFLRQIPGCRPPAEGGETSTWVGSLVGRFLGRVQGLVHPEVGLYFLLHARNDIDSRPRPRRRVRIRGCRKRRGIRLLPRRGRRTFRAQHVLPGWRGRTHGTQRLLPGWRETNPRNPAPTARVRETNPPDPAPNVPRPRPYQTPQACSAAVASSSQLFDSTSSSAQLSKAPQSK